MSVRRFLSLVAGALTLIACGRSGYTPADGGSNGGDGSVFTGAGQAPVAVDCTHRGSGRDIQVGNPSGATAGHELAVATLGEVPWESLEPGDTVRIFHRATPYHEKFAIARSGTLAQPIRVCGVPGPSGELPVLSADRATTRAALGDVFEEYVSYSMQQTGIIVIRGPEYEGFVEHVHIEGLALVESMHPPYHADDVNQFVDWDGATRDWDDSAAGIRIQKARNIVVRGNEFYHLNTGLYIISQAYAENFMVRDILIEGNYFHENALVEDYDKHQAYIQGTGFTIQYNYFGSPIAGSLGNDLKMRTAGDVIRYNYFENGAHAIDLVDIEDYVELVMPWHFAQFVGTLPEGARDAYRARQEADWAAYQATFVYGNLFHMVGEDAWPSVIHYGFDNSPFDRRPGTLFFYFNTMVYETDYADDDTMRVFDCGSDFADSFYQDDAQQVGGLWHFVVDGTDYGPLLQQVPEDFPVMRATNNALVLLSHTHGMPRSDFEWNRWAADQVVLDRNFITAGWDAQDIDSSATVDGFGASQLDPSVVYPGGNAAHHVSGVENLVTSSDVPVDLATFAPLASSPLRGAAMPLPAGVPIALLPVFEVRRIAGSPGRLEIAARATRTTLGAIE
jgi:hypothetical protein